MVPRGHWYQDNIGLFWKTYEEGAKSTNVVDKVNSSVKGYSHELNQNQILDTDYSAANFNEIAMEQTHLLSEERDKLFEVLRKHAEAFQGKKANGKAHQCLSKWWMKRSLSMLSRSAFHIYYMIHYERKLTN